MFRQCKIGLRFLLPVLFCLFFLCSSASASPALVIPAKQKAIGAEAYYGDHSLQAVVLQEGIVSIGSRAFADSTLTDITLPSTLASIADDAFDGAPLTTVHAEKGSWAYQWMREKGYITEYRALLIGEQRFLWFTDDSNPFAGYGLDDRDQRNIGDLRSMTAALNNTAGPYGPYGSAGDAFQITQKTNLTYDGIRSAIRTAFADTRDQDISVFFIATHGQETQDGDLRTAFTGSFNSRDQVAEYWQNHNLSFNTLASWLTTYVNGRVLVILESCGSGSAIYTSSAEENGPRLDSAPSAGTGSKDRQEEKEKKQAEQFAARAVEVFSEADPGIAARSGNGSVPSPKKSTGDLRLPKFYVLAASRHGEKSYGWETHEAETSYNYFTRWLTEGIGSEENSPADTDRNGFLTLTEMFDYVKQYDHITDGSRTYYQYVQRYPASSADHLLKLRAPFSYSVTGSQGNPHILRSGNSTAFTVSRSVLDTETYGRFESVFVDKLALEPDRYATGRGSLVLTLKSTYLDTLSEGTHKVLIRFSDGETETDLTVKGNGKVPKTGDSSRPLLWLGLLLAGLSGLLLSARFLFPKRKRDT